MFVSRYNILKQYDCNTVYIIYAVYKYINLSLNLPTAYYKINYNVSIGSYLNNMPIFDKLSWSFTQIVFCYSFSNDYSFEKKLLK